MDTNFTPSHNGIKKITTIGTGTMGPGVALAFAQAGLEVTVYGRNPAGVADCKAAIENNLQTYVALGLIDQTEKARIANSIDYISDIVQEDGTRIERLQEAVQDADFVIESIREDMDDKQDLLKKLDEFCKADAIIATNTSSLDIDEMKLVLSAARRLNFIAAHFFFPADMMPGMEVIRSKTTSDATASRTMALMSACLKEPILLQKATNGFVVNLVQAALGYAAFSLLEKGYTPTQIDTMIGSANLFDAIGTENAKPEAKTDNHPILQTAKSALNNAISRLVDAGVANRAEIDGVLRATLGLRYPVTGTLMTMDMAGLDVFHAILTNCREFLGIETGVPKKLVMLKDRGFIGAKTATEGRKDSDHNPINDEMGFGIYAWTVGMFSDLKNLRLDALADYQKQARRPVATTAATMQAATQG